MARVYLDNDVDYDLVQALQVLDRAVTHTRDLPRMRRAPDSHQLRYATQQRSILVTHNGEDFTLLHHAWHTWAEMWGRRDLHGGILVVPQGIPPADLANIIHDIATHLPTLEGELHIWQRDRGWRLIPPTPYRP